MKISATGIEGLLIIEPHVFEDDRGYFFETFNKQRYELPYAQEFVQDNEAKSNKGVLRGLHLQQGEYAQGKLVRVVHGSVFDVAVDVRPSSDSYGQWFGIELSGGNKKQLWVPRGFAHGYLVLEDNTIFSYKCDNYYNQLAEQGIRYDDQQLKINWPDVGVPYIVSNKDLLLGTLADIAL
ncbi:MAG TPA: dTDP-4-dehydrorhamnose 3,5-epimerase, partial [Saprospiraceae bacterium]|nr:dTDP-4-dehydrorhamnose 3,5-epimerase [Saprospiraceae bacterium]